MAQGRGVGGTLLQIRFVLAVLAHNTKRGELILHTELPTLHTTANTYSVLPESFWSFVGLPQVKPSKLPLSDSEVPYDFRFWTPSGFTLRGEFDTTSIRFFFLRIMLPPPLSFFRFLFTTAGISPIPCTETECEEDGFSVGMDDVVFWHNAPFFRSMRILDEFYSSSRSHQKKQKKTIAGFPNWLCHPHSSQQPNNRIVPTVAEKTRAKVEFHCNTPWQKKWVFRSFSSYAWSISL